MIMVVGGGQGFGVDISIRSEVETMQGEFVSSPADRAGFDVGICESRPRGGILEGDGEGGCVFEIERGVVDWQGIIGCRVEAGVGLDCECRDGYRKTQWCFGAF